MYKILLLCSTGMSTSILIKSIEEAAAAKGLEVQVKATSTIAGKDEVDNFDVVFLGPQVRYELPTFKKICGEKGIPVEPIDPIIYGRAQGDKVLDIAINKIKAAGN